jgi:hypothetical protein
MSTCMECRYWGEPKEPEKSGILVPDGSEEWIYFVAPCTHKDTIHKKPHSWSHCHLFRQRRREK